jgi:hypothetical protein
METHARKAIVTSGRSSFALGLTWFTVDAATSPAMAAHDLLKELRGGARQDLGAAIPDLVVIRKDPVPQFALASKIDGMRERAIAAAGIVADTLCQDIAKTSWLLAVRFDGGFWICAGRDFSILPHGDAVYATEEEARVVFLGLLNQGGWDTVYAPAAWELQTEEVTFDEVTSATARKWTRLAPTSNAKRMLKASAVASIIGLGAYAAATFLTAEPKTPSIDAQRAAQLAILAQQQAKLARSYAEFDAVKPWEGAAPADAMVSNCIGSIRAFPTSPFGYQTSTIQCVNGATQASITRDDGFAAWAEEWSKARPELALDLDVDGERGYLAMSTDPLAKQGECELPAYADVAERIFRHGQVLGASVKIAVPTIQARPDYPEYKPLFGAGRVSIASLRPETWVDLFSKVPCAAIDRIELDVQNETYLLEGMIYVHNR